MTTLHSILTILQEHDETAPAFGSPFEVEFGLFFWTWLVFFALLFTLKKFAWPAIVRATEERERKIALQLEETEKMNAAAQEALAEHRRLLDGAKEEATKLITDAKTVAEKERENLIAKTRADQEQMLERAKREIEAERERAVTDLRREAVELSLAAASKLVESNLDDAGNRKLVTDYLSSIEATR